MEQNICYKCNKKGHYSINCNGKKKVNFKEKPKPLLCKRCGRIKHTNTECQEITYEDGNIINLK